MKALFFKISKLKLLVTAIFFSFLYLACASSPEVLPPELERPAHHTATGFRNTDTSVSPILDTMQIDSLVGIRRTKVYALPIFRGNEFLWTDPTKNSATWIGHSTFYIRWNQIGILTDPIFSDRASPVTFAGPKRGTPPGRALDSLPEVHLVILSHSHYDHLDKRSIRAIYKKYPNVVFAVPLKVKPLFELWKIPSAQIIELDWWESAYYQNLKLTFVPAHHTSRRGAFKSSRDVTLWGGWILELNEKKIWFAGDIAMGDGSYYQAIAERFAPIDLSFLPIGSYKPSRYTRQHVSPRQSAQLHLLTESKHSIGMHWGTFGDMTFEKLEDPPADLKRARRELDISENDFHVLRHGEIIEILE